MTRAASQILDDAILRVDVGVGIGLGGRVDRVRCYDDRGDVALTKDDCLRQLRARTLASSFVMGIDGLMAIEDEPEESQLVAGDGRPRRPDLHAGRARAPRLRPARP